MYLAATDETLPASRKDKRLQVALPYHRDNDGCTAQIPGDQHLDRQHEIQKAGGIADDIVQKSQGIHPVDFLEQLQLSLLNRGCVIVAFSSGRANRPSVQGKKTKNPWGRRSF